MADWYVSSAAWTAIAQFATGSYSVGQIVRPLTAPAFAAQYAFRCTTAGSASAEPAWPAANNATVTATGGAVFTNVTGQSTYGWSAAAGNLYCISPNATNRLTIGDRVFLSSDHSETSLSSYNWPIGYGVIQHISVNRAGSVPPQAADYLAGASIANNGSGNWWLEANTNTYWQGVTFNTAGSATSFLLTNSANKGFYLRNCAIVFSTSVTTASLTIGSLCNAVLDNTRIQFNNAGQSIHCNSADFRWINTSSPFPGTAPTTLFTTNGSGSPITLRGVDLSAVAGTVFVTNANTVKGLLDSCRIAPGVTRLSLAALNVAGDEVELVNCFDGANILSERHTDAGDLTTNRNSTLVGGAQDDVGLFSHQMVSSSRADMLAMTLDSFWMDVEQSAVGASHTATVEIFSAASLNNTDISLALEYLSTSGSSLASFTSTLPSALTAPAALPTSTAAWNNPNPQNAWDPTFNPANFALSASNLQAALVPSGHQNIRVLYSFNSGKIYFEATVMVQGGTSGSGPGIGNASAGTTFLGGSINGFQYISNGAVYTNNGVLATIATYVVGDVICVAVDIGNKKLWYRKNNGNWNNTAGNDPGSNVGGYDLTALLGSNGTIYAAFDGWQAGDSVRINMGGTTFAQTVPTGFSTIPTGPTGTLQHIQATFTPQQAGRLRGIVRLGKPGTTVYVNPQIIVT